MVPPANIIILNDHSGDNVYVFSMKMGAFPWQAKRVAVTTVSQLLDASEEVFQEAAADAADTFAT